MSEWHLHFWTFLCLALIIGVGLLRDIFLGPFIKTFLNVGSVFVFTGLKKLFVFFASHSPHFAFVFVDGAPTAKRTERVALTARSTHADEINNGRIVLAV